MTFKGRGMTQQKNAVASVSTVPGPQSVALFTAEQEFLSPGIQRIAQLACLTMSHGEGATLTDIDGNRYIDFYAGVTVAVLGMRIQNWWRRWKPRSVKSSSAVLRRKTAHSCSN